jgi:transglutaminase-like putative cysteine protease
VPAPIHVPARLPADSWRAVDGGENDAEMHDWLIPSRYTTVTPALAAFTKAVGFVRLEDPLTTLRRLNATIYDQFAYEPRTTRVDSPIDDALRARAGVCQDFTHIMTALARSVGLPARYVSGYIAPRESPHDRSSDNATHAWMEAHLPALGWVGFDPTNNALAGERHIAVAVGRDYSDVPPTRGVFKGDAGSELRVGVAVSRAEVPVEPRELAPAVSWITPPRAPASDAEAHHAQRQQQQ